MVAEMTELPYSFVRTKVLLWKGSSRASRYIWRETSSRELSMWSEKRGAFLVESVGKEGLGRGVRERAWA